MSKYHKCPTCGNEVKGGFLGGAYIKLHKCKDKGHIFCNECKNGDRCPICTSDNILWNYDKAFPKK